MPTPNEELLERFYGAFAKRDGAGMEACYSPDVSFSDPVFTDLHGAEAGGMWRMLTGRAKDLEVELPSVRPTANAGPRAGGRPTRTARPGGPS